MITIAEQERQQRKIRFLSALRRVHRTGTSAARTDLKDIRLICEAHGDAWVNPESTDYIRTATEE